MISILGCAFAYCQIYLALKFTKTVATNTVKLVFYVLFKSFWIEDLLDEIQIIFFDICISFLLLSKSLIYIYIDPKFVSKTEKSTRPDGWINVNSSKVARVLHQFGDGANHRRLPKMLLWDRSEAVLERSAITLFFFFLDKGNHFIRQSPENLQTKQ